MLYSTSIVLILYIISSLSLVFCFNFLICSRFTTSLVKQTTHITIIIIYLIESDYGGLFFFIHTYGIHVWSSYLYICLVKCMYLFTVSSYWSASFLCLLGVQVQHMIEKCLIFHMTKEECMEALKKHAKIEPVITSTGLFPDRLFHLCYCKTHGKYLKQKQQKPS